MRTSSSYHNYKKHLISRCSYKFKKRDYERESNSRKSGIQGIAPRRSEKYFLLQLVTTTYFQHVYYQDWNPRKLIISNSWEALQTVPKVVRVTDNKNTYFQHALTSFERVSL